MGSHFRRNVATTSGFFLVRFFVALIVAFAYIFVAAGIQYAVVGILGESTFNYIVGGLLSLFLGAIVCDRVGALIFMFVRGWHVAALAYATKIRKAHVSAVTVGRKAFTKNIVGFGAVYGVRVLAKNMLAQFKDALWGLLENIPLAANLQQFAENPIVEHMAADVLNYGFDATIFYIVKNPPEDVADVPSTVMEGLKRYLYCLPSIMITSVSSYILFRFLPQLVKWLVILWVLLTQGLCGGILITVLMWPIFYILDNALFQPLTMVMFISCFSKQCNEEIDEESPTVQYVNSILDGVGIGTHAEDLEEVEESEEEEEPQPKKPAPKAKPKVAPPPPPTPQADPDIHQVEAEPDLTALGIVSSAPVSRETISSLEQLGSASWRQVPPPEESSIPSRDSGEDLWAGLPLTDEANDTGAQAPPPPPIARPSVDSPDYDAMLVDLSGAASQGSEAPAAGTSSLSDLLRSFNANSQDLGRALDGDDDGSGISDVLSGGDF